MSTYNLLYMNAIGSHALLYILILPSSVCQVIITHKIVLISNGDGVNNTEGSGVTTGRCLLAYLQFALSIYEFKCSLENINFQICD